MKDKEFSFKGTFNNFYVLAIVGIVAVVGLVIMFVNAGKVSYSSGSADAVNIGGQGFKQSAGGNREGGTMNPFCNVLKVKASDMQSQSGGDICEWAESYGSCAVVNRVVSMDYYFSSSSTCLRLQSQSSSSHFVDCQQEINDPSYFGTCMNSEDDPEAYYAEPFEGDTRTTVGYEVVCCAP